MDLDLCGSDREWMGEAICASADPEAWFPPLGVSTAQVKAICNGTRTRRGCPVRDQCLAYALKHDERFGVWGGRGERERRGLKRAGKEAKPTVDGAG